MGGDDNMQTTGTSRTTTGAGVARGKRGCARRKDEALGEMPELGSGDFGLDNEEFGVPLQAVVKIFATHSEPNFSLPWQRRRQHRSSGSGFIIDTSRRAILTNAHCIEW